MADIEKGMVPDNFHVRIGSHWGIVSELIYEYENTESNVTKTYYPIISEEHPFNKAVDAYHAKYPDGDGPADEFPVFKDFTVLVLTDRWSNTSQFPEFWTNPESIQGLFVNEVEKLGSEELDLLRQSFPSINPDNFYILEEGRAPGNQMAALGMMGGGGILSFAGVGAMVMRRKRDD